MTMAPCNCGGKKVKQGPGIAGAPVPAPAPTSGNTQQFALTSPGGRVQRFGSRLEADATNARQGGAGTVRPV